MISELPLNAILGLQAFNQGDFFSAHEFFEDAWRDTPGEPREFFRSLLQFSAGYHRLTQDRPEAARKFFARALHWMRKYTNPYLGLDTAEIKTILEALISAINSGGSSEAILRQYAFHITWTSEEKSA